MRASRAETKGWYSMSSALRIYEINSSSFNGLPAAASSSASPRMYAKKVATDCVPFCALVRAARMLLTRDSDVDENMLASAVQSSRACAMEVTCTSTSLDRLFKR